MLRRLAKSALFPLYEPVRMRLESLAERSEMNAVLFGKTLAESFRTRSAPASLTEAEFKVCSQFGEDGIIQYLLSRVAIADRTFVEIGVEDYQEANTRFLLVANKWRGLVIEGRPGYVEKIRASSLSWRCSLTARCSFVTTENVNLLLEEAAIGKDIGLLSVDIDGNDYWIWNAVTMTRARIVVCEFNKLYGCDLAVTIPYDPDFVASRAHPSRTYGGASLAALASLGAKKGYSLVGCTSEGVNAFFVRNDVLGALKPLTPHEAFTTITPPRPGDERVIETKLSAIAHLPMTDVESGETKPIRDLADRMRPSRSTVNGDIRSTRAPISGSRIG